MGSTVDDFDVQAARSHFPALNQTSQIYFDNAGGSQILGEVIDSIVKYLAQTNVQMGGHYAVGKQSTEKYNEGMKAAAQYINAGPDEIVLGSSTTQLMRNLSSALTFQDGDELILSKLDHEANIAAWVQLAERRGLTVKWWSGSAQTKNGQPNTNPKLDVESLKSLLSERTRLVACTHTSNILGTIHDIKKIAEAVHTIPGALLVVDAVAYAPHRQVDVQDLGVDYYALSWYKIYGPHIAMLYGRRALHPTMTSLGHYFHHPPYTLESLLGLAGSSYELTASIPQVLAYIGPNPASKWAAIAAHEEKLQAIILGYLRSKGRMVSVYGEEEASSSLRVPVISFNVEGWKAADLVERVQGASRFGFKSGHFYSKRLVDDVLRLGAGDGEGEGGVVRVSLVHYNTEEEAREFVALLDRVISDKGE